MFQCFILHVTTSKTVLQMFYAKTIDQVIPTPTLGFCSNDPFSRVTPS